MIDDELTFALFESHNEQQQQKIVSAYCSSIEDRIQKASTQQQAEEIVEQSCSEFSRTCRSEILKRQLTLYVHALLKKYWSEK